MAQKAYKQLSCRQIGADCDFLVRGEKEDEVLSLVSEHACRDHDICEVTPELKDKMESILCEGSCHGVAKAGLRIPAWG